MLLMIDNYDSFTYNLVQYLQSLGAEVKVVRNDAMTVDEIAKLAPQRGAVADSSRPARVQPGEVCVERAFPRAEHIRALAAQDAPHRSAAMTGAPDDLLDRLARLVQRQDRGVGVLTSEITLVLELLRRGQQPGVDRGGADSRAHLAHAGSGRGQKSLAGVLHQVPTIGYLHRIR